MSMSNGRDTRAPAPEQAWLCQGDVEERGGPNSKDERGGPEMSP